MSRMASEWPEGTEAPPGLGGYRLLQQLGQRGRAATFLARRSGADGVEKTFAFKCLFDALEGSAELEARLLDECRRVAALRHPSIAEVYDFGASDGTFYVAMEHVDGRDLGAIQRRLRELGRKMPLGIALRLAADVCAALEHAHGRTDEVGAPQPLVHGGVSPANVMVTREGVVKLLDFATARVMGERQPGRSGTNPEEQPAFLAPEQLRSEGASSGVSVGASVRDDARVDVYGLGAVLYLLLTDRRASDEPRDLRALRPELPESVVELTRRALEPDRERRFASATEMGRALGAELTLLAPTTGPAKVATFVTDLFAPEASRAVSMVATRMGLPAVTMPLPTLPPSAPAPDAPASAPAAFDSLPPAPQVKPQPIPAVPFEALPKPQPLSSSYDPLPLPPEPAPASVIAYGALPMPALARPQAVPGTAFDPAKPQASGAFDVAKPQPQPQPSGAFDLKPQASGAFDLKPAASGALDRHRHRQGQPEAAILLERAVRVEKTERAERRDRRATQGIPLLNIRRRFRRKRTLLTVSALAALAIVLTGAFALRRGTPHPDPQPGSLPAPAATAPDPIPPSPLTPPLPVAAPPPAPPAPVAPLAAAPPETPPAVPPAVTPPEGPPPAPPTSSTRAALPPLDDPMELPSAEPTRRAPPLTGPGGVFDGRVLQKIVRKARVKFARCLAYHGESQAKSRRQLAVFLRVASTGKVTAADVNLVGVTDEPLATCLEREASRLRFPRHPEKEVRFSFPVSGTRPLR